MLCGLRKHSNTQAVMNMVPRTFPVKKDVSVFSLCITESIFVGAYSGAAHEVCKQGLVRMGVQFWSLIPISVSASRSLQLFEFILIPLLTKVQSLLSFLSLVVVTELLVTVYKVYPFY